MKKINHQLIAKYREKYKQLAETTNRPDKARAEQAFADFYASKGYPPPEVIWADSPWAAQEKVSEILDGPGAPLEKIVSYAEMAHFGSFGSHWICFYKYVAEEVDKRPDPDVEIAERIAQDCCMFWNIVPGPATDKYIVVAAKKPVEICLDEKGLLHAERKLAVRFEDGRGLYAKHGEAYASMVEAALAERAARE